MLVGSNATRPDRPVPSIARFVVRNWAIGALLGAALAGVLILTNAGGLLDLLRQSSDAAIAIAVFVFGFSTLLAGLYSGAAIMLISHEDG